MLGVMSGRDIDDWNQGVGELPPLVSSTGSALKLMPPIFTRAID
jgi:hypothetical protein